MFLYKEEEKIFVAKTKVRKTKVDQVKQRKLSSISVQIPDKSIKIMSILM